MSVTTSMTTGRSAFSACWSAGPISTGFDADPERADVLGDLREVLLRPLPALGLLAAAHAVEAALRLVAARVVVDEGDGVELQRTAVALSMGPRLRGGDGMAEFTP